MGKRVITVEDILQAAAAGLRSIPAPPEECLVTPGARDKAETLGISLGEELAGSSAAGPSPAPAPPSEQETLIKQVCAQLGSRLPAGLESRRLERLVREVVTARLSGSAQAEPKADGPEESLGQGIRFVTGQRLLDKTGGPVPVAEKVLVAEAMRPGGEAGLAGGYMKWAQASFPRIVESPEIVVVLEGELHLTAGGKTMAGRPGDMIYLPQGAEVVFAAPGQVRLACVNRLK